MKIIVDQNYIQLNPDITVDDVVVLPDLTMITKEPETTINLYLILRDKPENIAYYASKLNRRRNTRSDRNV
jgi:hypothetical protein